MGASMHIYGDTILDTLSQLKMNPFALHMQSHTAVASLYTYHIICKTVLWDLLSLCKLWLICYYVRYPFLSLKSKLWNNI